MKLKKFFALFAAASLVVSSVAVTATASDDDIVATYLDFSNEEVCQSYIDSAATTDGATLSVRSKSLGGFGLFASFNKEAEGADKPYVTFDTQIDADKYSYAKIVYAYSKCKNTDTTATDTMKSYIKIGEGAENTVANIAANGNSLTDVGGNEHKNSEYTTNARRTTFVSTVLPVNSADSGKVTFCPASTADGKAIDCAVLVKYIAFFEKEDDAKKFDISVQGAEFKKDGADTSYAGVVNPFENKVDITLPRLYVKEGGFTLDNITVSLNSKPVSVTSSSLDGFSAVYTVSSFDGSAHEWTVNIICEQADSENIAKMLLDLNGADETAIGDTFDTWAWIINDQCENASLITDATKDKFLGALLQSEELTTANWKNVIDTETKFASLVSSADVAEAQSKAQELGFSNEVAYSLYFNSLETESQDKIFASVKESTNFADLKEKLYLGIYGESISYGNVKDLVEGDLEYFGFTDESYNELIAKTDDLAAAYSSVLAQNITDASQIADKLKKAVDEIGITDDDEVTNVSNKRPSGGGGGGGGGISVSVSGSASVSGAVHPAVTPEEVETPEEDNSNAQKGFADLADVEWARESIERLYEKGIVNGKSATEFAPNDNVTREEFVKMLVCALGLSGEGEIDFNDVKNDAWYYDYIVKAVSLGVVNGKDNGSFGVGDDITREDMAAMVLRAVNAVMGSVEYNGSDASFADAEEISSYAKDAVNVLSGFNVLNGYNGSFMPKNKATRAETAVVIDRLITLVETFKAGGNQ